MYDALHIYQINCDCCAFTLWRNLYKMGSPIPLHPVLLQGTKCLCLRRSRPRRDGGLGGGEWKKDGRRIAVVTARQRRRKQKKTQCHLILDTPRKQWRMWLGRNDGTMIIWIFFPVLFCNWMNDWANVYVTTSTRWCVCVQCIWNVAYARRECGCRVYLYSQNFVGQILAPANGRLLTKWILSSDWCADETTGDYAK